MTVKELKEILNTADDDAIVLLYDGLDEGDVFCTNAVQVLGENYEGYCQADSCTDDYCPDKLFVLAGFGTVFSKIDDHKNMEIFMFSRGPEGLESKRLYEEKKEKERSSREAESERLRNQMNDQRKKRYCLNYNLPRDIIQEANADTVEELEQIIDSLSNKFDYVIYDRAEGAVIRSHHANQKDLHGDDDDWIEPDY